MKLWDKGIATDKKIELFTIGKDRELDIHLASFDIVGTIAHAIMLQKIGILSEEDLNALLPVLKNLYQQAADGRFKIEEGIEDVHSQVEFELTKQLGDIGKKVHSGRSRNDQVLLDLKLFARHKIMDVVQKVVALFQILQEKSEKHKSDLLPGYTHLQVAMPSSFGLWFGAYAESLVDDLLLTQAAWKIVNQNPLGSAAGYGNSFPLDRSLTTQLLGFEDLNYNVVYAQMGRGKMERTVAVALSSIATTLARLAMDACLYMSQNFGFIKLPDEFTTGSSIMPHKKNPDVFELLRAKCNKLINLPQEIACITANLPSGYFRDLQIIKEMFVPAFDELLSCLDITILAVGNIEVVQNIMDNQSYKYAFSVEEVNRLVLQGVPFRDAYKRIAKEIEEGKFNPDTSHVNHTHEGSIGNLCNDKIEEKMKRVLNGFTFQRVQSAMEKLIS